jgi:hypothetical protein
MLNKKEILEVIKKLALHKEEYKTLYLTLRDNENAVTLQYLEDKCFERRVDLLEYLGEL